MRAVKDRRRHRRGLAGQRLRRGIEREVRKAAVALSRWCSLQGLPLREQSARLGVRPQTLRRWRCRWSSDRMELCPRGRPVERGSPDLRHALIGLFSLAGPTLGVPALRELLPDAPRRELEELTRRVKRMLDRGKGGFLVTQLRWTRPGAVWAIDFSEPQEKVDGLYPRLVCVRDLASGQQLMALPCFDETTATARSVMRALLRWNPAPLVLKCDNGSAFVSPEFREELESWGIQLLFSPPSYPQYNGAIEAGIGGLKTRLHWISARHGRPGEWTCDDVEEARRHANATIRLDRGRGPSPDQAWDLRLEIRDHERALFHSAIKRYLLREESRHGVLDSTMLGHSERTQIERVAVTRALIENSLVVFRRRRVSLPFSKRKQRINS